MTDEQKAQLLKEAIPSIDIDGCVENYTGTLDFYLEMLWDFVESKHVENMEKAFASEDFATYRIEAHSLKGLSRSVGLNDIGKLAEELQFACDNQNYELVKSKHFQHVATIKDCMKTVQDIWGRGR